MHPSIGSGYEFAAITAVVLGGVLLGGGRGWVLSAVAGAFALEMLFTLLTVLGVASTWRDTVQGVIIIVAVAAAARAWQVGRRPRRDRPDAASRSPAPDPPRPRDPRTRSHHHARPGHEHRRQVMRRPFLKAALASAAALAVLTACSTDDSLDNPDAEASDKESRSSEEWFVQADFDEQDQQRSATFEGDPETPWLQYIDGEMTDTAEFNRSKPQKVCFANASISNPWRQTGWITMNQQLKALQDKGVISEMETRDAEDDDNTQIADIDYFISEGNCDVFIISPNSTAAMTPGRRAGL